MFKLNVERYRSMVRFKVYDLLNSYKGKIHSNDKNFNALLDAKPSHRWKPPSSHPNRSSEALDWLSPATTSAIFVCPTTSTAGSLGTAKEQQTTQKAGKPGLLFQMMNKKEWQLDLIY